MNIKIPARRIGRRDTNLIRIANAPFLNSVPYSPAKDLPWVSYTEAHPAECARLLFEDECEVSLIPVAEWFAGGDSRFELLPFGIAADQPVTSVLLFSDCPPQDVEEVYVDQSTRSSIALFRVLVSRMGKPWQEIKYFRTSADAAIKKVSGKAAALLIGDAAREVRNQFPYVLDLAEAWTSTTKLPMIFAVWAARRGCLSEERKAELIDCFENGLNQRSILARGWIDRRENPQPEAERVSAERYVSTHIAYSLSPRFLRGAEEFRAMGIECGVFPQTAPLIEFDDEVTHSRRPSIDGILARAANGERISPADALDLAANASLADLALAANEVRTRLIRSNKVSYIVDRNINYTNVCNVFCRFCAFYRAPGKSGGYLLSKEEIGKKIEDMMAAGGIQILLQGGLNPELGIEYYEDLFRWIKSRYPINLHALSADEIIHIVRVSGISIEETLSRLIAAGLGSFPGGGAEILVDRVRNKIARLKSTTEEWLEVHRTAHRLGLRSTCTMMFGVRESWDDRILHLHKLRSLQDDTKGFTAFITWPFQDEELKLPRGDTSSSEYLRVQSIARLFLDNIDHVQSSWVTMGPSIGQAALEFGADDFGSVMFEENVVSSAGTTYCLDSGIIERHIDEAGFQPWRRDIHYRQAPAA